MSTLSMDATPQRRQAVVPNGVLGMLIFICTEVMFFIGLVSAFLIIKAGSLGWPPPGQPRLPVEATAFNTTMLLTSGVVLFMANRLFVTEGATVATKRLTSAALALGSCFVLFQGYEWMGLVGYGLTMTSSPYGSFFYMIVGVHGLHAIVAITALAMANVRLSRGELTAEVFWTVQAFWYFVVGVWPFLYALVYLG